MREREEVEAEVSQMSIKSLPALPRGAPAYGVRLFKTRRVTGEEGRNKGTSKKLLG